MLDGWMSESRPPPKITISYRGSPRPLLAAGADKPAATSEIRSIPSRRA